MTQNFISVGECAKLLGADRSHLLKDIKGGKYGHISIEFRRDREKQNQKVATISTDDYELIKKFRNAEGFGTSQPITSTSGVFYIVQTNPAHIPSRYKFGFTNDLPNRLRSYKSICPNLKVIATYPCESIHEQPLIRMAGGFGKRIGQELYEVQDIEKVKHDIELVLSKLIPSDN